MSLDSANGLVHHFNACGSHDAATMIRKRGAFIQSYEESEDSWSQSDSNLLAKKNKLK
jgi:hypothetical protein